MTIAKKEQMLHAVITSIRQTGFAQLKMDDFIRIMPASRSTVYRYFASREAVLAAVVDEYVTYVQAIQVPVAPANPSEWVAGFNQLLEQQIVFNGNISQVFLSDLATELPPESQRLQAAIHSFEQTLAAFYTNGQTAQVFNQQNVQLWLLQDQSMLPQLLDPTFLVAHDFTLTSALTSYCHLKAQQVLRPAYQDQLSTDFIAPLVQKMSASYFRKV